MYSKCIPSHHGAFGLARERKWATRKPCETRHSERYHAALVISDSFQIRRNHTLPQGQCPHPLKLLWCSLRGLPSSLPLCIPIRLHVAHSPSVYTGLCSTSLSSACFRLKLPKSHQPTLSDGTCLGNGTTHSGQVFSLPSNNQDNSQRPVSQVILDSAKLTINSNFLRSFQQDRRGIRVGLDMTDTSDLSLHSPGSPCRRNRAFSGRTASATISISGDLAYSFTGKGHAAPPPVCPGAPNMTQASIVTQKAIIHRQVTY